ncbi:hypothetical protein D1007_43524 [Hordeum vulgare]|nr:hypothetical protein D1007_43524 [Hordeum vulgare]
MHAAICAGAARGRPWKPCCTSPGALLWVSGHRRRPATRGTPSCRMGTAPLAASGWSVGPPPPMTKPCSRSPLAPSAATSVTDTLCGHASSERHFPSILRTWMRAICFYAQT